MDLTPTEKLILKDLQRRETLSIKNSQERSTISYRQFLRKIDALVNKKAITGWIPIIHPLVRQAKKIVWFFVKTNPRDPQDLEYFKSLGGQVLTLDGIAGMFSLVALIQFNDDQEFNRSIEKIEQVFQVSNPILEPQRYQYLEIIAFYKYNGFPIKNLTQILNSKDLDILNALTTFGLEMGRPPTYEEMANTVDISISSMQKKIKNFEDSNAILGYSISLNKELKPPIKMIVQIKLKNAALQEIIEILQYDDHVPMLLKTQSDNYPLLAVVYTKSIHNFNIWLKELYSNKNILDTLTTVVLNDEADENSLLFPIL